MYSQSVYFEAAKDQAKADIVTIGNNCHYVASRNIYIDKNNVIHIFIFEDGNLLLAGYPTTATEKDKYQVHLYLKESNNDNYRMEYTGSYSPSLNIENSGLKAFVRTAKIKSMDFAIIGPFTNSLQLNIKRLPKTSDTWVTLSTTTIQISKTIHVSIGSGLLYSSLKNPGNIRKVPITTAGNDSTLIADDVHGRGVVTLFATYFPWGRNNLMMPGWSFKERFGIVVGTSIASSSNNFGDLFVGASYDFSIGGSLVAGVHYGRRQEINGVDYNHFKFGESKFSGNLDDNKYMNWNAGFFLGVQIDSRIFSQLLK
jgi:hypothetical protein